MPTSTSAIRQSSGAIATTSVGFEAKLAAIGDHPGGEGFRGAILRASASYVAEHGIDEDTRLWLAETIRARALQADRSPERTDAEIDEKANLESILKQIDGAAKKFVPIDPTRRRAKLGASEPAHFAGARLSAEEASAQLQQAVASFFEC